VVVATVVVQAAAVVAMVAVAVAVAAVVATAAVAAVADAAVAVAVVATAAAVAVVAATAVAAATVTNDETKKPSLSAGFFYGQSIHHSSSLTAPTGPAQTCVTVWRLSANFTRTGMSASNSFGVTSLPLRRSIGFSVNANFRSIFRSSR